MVFGLNLHYLLQYFFTHTQKIIIMIMIIIIVIIINTSLVYVSVNSWCKSTLHKNIDCFQLA